MKTRLYVVMLVLMLGVTTTSPLAQDLPLGDGRNATFLSYMEEIKSLNQDLEDFTHMRPGTFYKLPNGTWERLGEFDTNGIWGREFQKAYNLSYEDFLERQSPSDFQGQPGDSGNNQAPLVLRFSDKGVQDWKREALDTLLLLLLVCVFLYGLYNFVMKPIIASRKAEQERWRQQEAETQRLAEQDRAFERELARDPVTSGPPMVPGGIPPSEPERLSQYLHAQATAQYADKHRVGMESVRPRVTRIGPIEHGLISGSGHVGYLNGRSQRRINPGLPGYRARFRFPDGTEQYLMSLEGCMNPCYTGGGMEGFTFTPHQQNGTVAETPQPAQPAPVGTTQPVVPTVTTPAPTPSAPEVVAATPKHTVGTDQVQFLTYVPANDHQPTMLRWQGLRFRRFDVYPDGTHVIRFDLATNVAPDAEQ